ncbi:MAG: hypothetical protein HQM10_26955 [Candidatus Riflebacteria bacterium]|nr:hypothetical protein [Candidatus Riflebacteria bacterium]
MMTETFSPKIITKGRESIKSVYANQNTIAFNQYEVGIEFSQVDTIEAMVDLVDGKKEISATSMCKIILSHQAAIELSNNLRNIIAEMQKNTIEKRS